MTGGNRRRRVGRLRRIATVRTARPRWRPSLSRLRAARRRQAASDLAHRRDLHGRYRRVGDRRGQRRRFAGRIAWQPRLASMELSTGTAEAIYPFQVTTATRDCGGQGVAIGPSPTGGTFTFDPWTAYRTGRLSNPNLLILGDIGSGKSALAKTLVWRGLEFGRGAHIIDPKGEYAPLAEAAGCRPLKLTPGGTTTVNPLDPGAAGAGLAPGDVFHRSLACVRALVEATLNRPCRQIEMVTLASALARVCGLQLTDAATPAPGSHGQTATLTMLTEALVDPPDGLAGKVNMDPARLVVETREIALALTRLVDAHGDLSGMFAGHTNVDADALGDVVVVDLSAVASTHRQALGLVMICAASWLQLATATHPRGRFQINDEAWALLADEATARWTQTNQKLSRQLSLSVVNVMHRLSDTAAAGDAGTAVRALAEGAIADSGTYVVYRQKPGEDALLADVLQLNDVQRHLACGLPRGRGLWVTTGDRQQVTLVDHLLSDIERQLVDTDTAIRSADQPHADRHDAGR